MQNQESLIPFRRFDSWQNAQHYVEMSEKTGIEYKLEEYDKNPVVLGSLLTEKEFLIKVRQEEFEQADEKLLQATEINVPDLEPNYYLFGFSDEELIEILVKPNEWGEVDRVLAPKLLINRGYNLENLDIKNNNNDIVYSDSGFPLLFHKECGRFPTKEEYMIIHNEISYNNGGNPNKISEPGYFDKFKP